MTALNIKQTIMDLIWKMDITIHKPVPKLAKLNAKIQTDVNIGLGIQVNVT